MIHKTNDQESRLNDPNGNSNNNKTIGIAEYWAVFLFTTFVCVAAGKQ